MAQPIGGYKLNNKLDANIVLELQEKWEHTDKNTIMDNLERFLIAKYPECRGFDTKLEKLMDISGAKKHTVYAWVNRSRENVKVPFLKLCEIAKTLDVDVDILLSHAEKVGE